MIFDQWLQEQNQLKNKIYAIADPQSIDKPHIVFCQSGGIDGEPLMNPRELTNPEDGPWLLPVNAKFLDWWRQNEHGDSGILISTNSHHEDLRAHFASLFQAIMLGESVFFPFYKPSYIAAILPRLESEEITLFLRDTNVLLRQNGQWENWESECIFTKAQPFKPEIGEPWWVIKEHHLDMTPNILLLTQNVESWLWQNHPSLMQSRVEQGMPRFKAAFQTNFTTLKPIALSLDKAMTIQEQTLMASVVTAYNSSEQITPKIKKSITELKDDELLFGLKTVFNQLQGLA